MDEIAEPISPLPYATPAPATGSSVAAGVWIMIGGLALIFLGGCFCIGIMISLNIGNVASGFGTTTTPGSGAGTTVFIALLYLLASACFGSALMVLVLGIRKLLAIGRS